MIDNSDLRRIIDQAKEKIKSLESENKSLKNELSRLSELRTEYRNLLNSYARLKLARALGYSEENKKRAYRRLTNMITEIDKCLKMLND